MSIILSQVKTLLYNNYSNFVQEGIVTPTEGDWRLRKSGSGLSSILIIERYESGVWVSKQEIS